MMNLIDHLQRFGMSLEVLKARRRIDHTKSWDVDKLDVRVVLRGNMASLPEGFTPESFKGTWFTHCNSYYIVEAAVWPQALSYVPARGTATGWELVAELVCVFPSGEQYDEINQYIEANRPAPQADVLDAERAAAVANALSDLGLLFTTAAELLTKAYNNEDKKET